jgi:hypothetical protein
MYRMPRDKGVLKGSLKPKGGNPRALAGAISDCGHGALLGWLGQLALGQGRRRHSCCARAAQTAGRRLPPRPRVKVRPNGQDSHRLCRRAGQPDMICVDDSSGLPGTLPDRQAGVSPLVQISNVRDKVRDATTSRSLCCLFANRFQKMLSATPLPSEQRHRCVSYALASTTNRRTNAVTPDTKRLMNLKRGGFAQRSSPKPSR